MPGPRGNKNNLKYPELQHLSSKERSREYGRIKRQKNPHINILYRSGGWTVEEYRNRLEEQNGLCAICGCPETQIRYGKVISLCADHNHRTGQARGLLCSRCNTTIGKFEERLDLFQSAVDYLKKWNGE